MSWRRGPRWSAYGRGALVGLLVAVAVLNSASVNGGRWLTPHTAAALVCGAALVVPRSRRVLAPFLTTAATAWWGWPLLPLLVVALFDLAVNRRARTAVGCGVAAMGANLLADPATSLWTGQQYGSTLFLLLAVVGGLWLGGRRRLVAALASQVDHLRVESQLREEAARAAERSRIAAEMHDVLAHRLSLIALHSGVLATKGDTLPAPVAERLGLLRTASTEALADLRDVLGALRDPGSAAPAGSSLAPVVREVRELVDDARAAGQHIELTADGRPEDAPTAHRLAVYRIVQEALTNARKHAGGAEVTVRVGYRPPATLVEVTNASGTPAADSVDSGYGLIGLRERVTTLGGDLTAGPAGAGTWRLAARIPHPAAHPVGIEQNGTRT